MTDQPSHNLGGLDIGTALSSQGASRTCARTRLGPGDTS